MKTMASILLLTAAVVSLAGCNEADTRPSDQNSRLVFRSSGRACGGAQGVPRQSRASSRKTPNCINANEARNKVTVQEMKDALK